MCRFRAGEAWPCSPASGGNARANGRIDSGQRKTQIVITTNVTIAHNDSADSDRSTPRSFAASPWTELRSFAASLWTEFNSNSVVIATISTPTARPTKSSSVISIMGRPPCTDSTGRYAVKHERWTAEDFAHAADSSVHAIFSCTIASRMYRLTSTKLGSSLASPSILSKRTNASRSKATKLGTLVSTGTPERRCQNVVAGGLLRGRDGAL